MNEENEVYNKKKKSLAGFVKKKKNPSKSILKSSLSRESIKSQSSIVEKFNFAEGFKSIFKNAIDQYEAKEFFYSSAQNIDEFDEEGRTVLHKACINIKLKGVMDIFDNLKCSDFKKLEYVNKVDFFGNYPILLTCKLTNIDCENDRWEIIKLLLENGADMNVFQKNNRWNIFHWLAYNVSEKSIVNLIDISGDLLLCPDIEGFYPIDLLGFKEDLKLVEILIQNLINRFKNYFSNDINTESNQNKTDNEKNKNDNEDNKNSNNKIGFFKNLGKFINSKKDESKPKLIAVNTDNNDIDSKLTKEIFRLNSHLKDLLLSEYINHCLYWCCKFKLNFMYVNQLLELKADPSVSYNYFLRVEFLA